MKAIDVTVRRLLSGAAGHLQLLKTRVVVKVWGHGTTEAAPTNMQLATGSSWHSSQPRIRAPPTQLDRKPDTEAALLPMQLDPKPDSEAALPPT